MSESPETIKENMNNFMLGVAKLNKAAKLLDEATAHFTSCDERVGGAFASNGAHTIKGLIKYLTSKDDSNV